MTLHQREPAGGSNRFHTTRWSLVLLSAQSQASGCQEAFAELCKLYWYPLYGFIRHRGRSPEDAQDLAQGFFLHLAKRKTLSRVDRSKGKFRSFLLASLQNYEDVADRLKISLGSLKTLIHRLRKQYTALVREEISRTVADSADVDAEIHELCEAMIAAEGWIMP